MGQTTNFAKKLHMRVKPVSMNEISIEICDIETQEHWILDYQFRDAKVTSRKIKDTTVSQEVKEDDEN